MLAVVEDGGLPVRDLRALAAELGVAFPPLAVLASRPSGTRSPA